MAKTSQIWERNHIEEFWCSWWLPGGWLLSFLVALTSPVHKRIQYSKVGIWRRKDLTSLPRAPMICWQLQVSRVGMLFCLAFLQFYMFSSSFSSQSSSALGCKKIADFLYGRQQRCFHSLFCQPGIFGSWGNKPFEMSVLQWQSHGTL